MPDRLNYREVLVQIIVDSAMRARLHEMPRDMLMPGLPLADDAPPLDPASQMQADIAALAAAPFGEFEMNGKILYQDPLADWLIGVAPQVADRNESHLLSTMADRLYGQTPPPGDVVVQGGPLIPLLLVASIVAGVWFLVDAVGPLGGPGPNQYVSGLEVRPPSPPSGWWGVTVDAYDDERRRVRLGFIAKRPVVGKPLAEAWTYDRAETVGDAKAPIRASTVLTTAVMRRWLGAQAIRAVFCVGSASMEGGVHEEEGRAEVRAETCARAVRPHAKQRPTWLLVLGKFIGDREDLPVKIRARPALTPADTAYQRRLILVAEMGAEKDADLGAALRNALFDPEVQAGLQFEPDDFSQLVLGPPRSAQVARAR